LADFGVVVFIGGGVRGGGIGDLLRPVSVFDPVDCGVGAVSVLEEYLVLGMVPDVDRLGEDGVVLVWRKCLRKSLTMVVFSEPRCWLLEARLEWLELAPVLELGFWQYWNNIQSDIDDEF
jgi:hypothetical protein